VQRVFGRNQSGRSMPRAGSAFILCPSIQVAYGALRDWLRDHSEIVSIKVHSPESFTYLNSIVAPLRVDAVSKPPHSQAFGPLRNLWQSSRVLVNRYSTVIVLCTTDDEATTGYTAFRILGELLLSDRIVLIGPSTARDWPGGRKLFTSTQVSEIATVAGAASIGLFTTAVMLAAVALQEVLMRTRIWRR
jgi:hypothetical protein